MFGTVQYYMKTNLIFILEQLLYNFSFSRKGAQFIMQEKVDSLDLL